MWLDRIGGWMKVDLLLPAPQGMPPLTKANVLKPDGAHIKGNRLF